MFEQETNNESSAPSNAAVKLKKAISFESAGKYESALMSIEEALLLQENYVDAWLLKGVILGKLGKCTEALKCYDKVIELNPNFEDAWRLKGAIYSMQNLHDKAADCFSKALELDQEDIEVRLNLAASFQKLKKFEETLKCYEEILKLKPDAQIHYLIGVTFGNKGDAEKALNSFDQALRLKPDFTNALIGKGVILAKLGRTDEAKLCAKKALETKTESAEGKSVQSNLTNDLIRQEYEAAQKRFKSTFSPNP